LIDAGLNKEGRIN